jgi:hypothetical protein
MIFLAPGSPGSGGVMQRPARLGLVALVLLPLSLLPVQARAQSRAEFEMVKGIDERFRLDMGGFFQEFSTTVRLDSASRGMGTEVNLEDDLGLKGSQANFRADGYWRFGRHARLDFAFINWNRRASRTLDRDFQIEDNVFHAGASVDTRLSVYTGELYYSYSLVNNPETEFALMLGVSTLFNSLSVEGQATVAGSGGTASGAFERQSRSLVAPIPAVGAHFRYTLLPGFLFSARIKGFGATIDNVKGSMLDWKVGLDYYPWKNVGVGAAWAQTDIRVTYKTDPTAELDYKYSGPMAYLSLVF